MNDKKIDPRSWALVIRMKPTPAKEGITLLSFMLVFQEGKDYTFGRYIGLMTLFLDMSIFIGFVKA